MRGFHYWWRRHHHSCHGSQEAHPGEAYGPHGDEGYGRGEGHGGGDGYFAHGRHRGHHGHGEGGGDDGEGMSFGVRRPLRFMANKLELRDDQVEQLAVVLNELKTERAQAAVDYRRTVNGFADALASSSFDEAKANTAGDERVRSAEHVRKAVQEALRKVHAMLDDEQRQRLAYLMRTGALTI